MKRAGVQRWWIISKLAVFSSHTTVSPLLYFGVSNVLILEVCFCEFKAGHINECKLKVNVTNTYST